MHKRQLDGQTVSQQPVPATCSIMVEPIFDYQFRLILIGDSTVGKSSLLKFFTDGKFAEVSNAFNLFRILAGSFLLD